MSRLACLIRLVYHPTRPSVRILCAHRMAFCLSSTVHLGYNDTSFQGEDIVKTGLSLSLDLLGRSGPPRPDFATCYQRGTAAAPLAQISLLATKEVPQRPPRPDFATCYQRGTAAALLAQILLLATATKVHLNRRLFLRSGPPLANFSHINSSE